MAVHVLAGKQAPREILIDVSRLIDSYYSMHPDVSTTAQKVSFGTSGHRGTSLDGSFTEDHIVAITQAICDFRKIRGIDGPLFLGMDTHALSKPAHRTALEVLAANTVPVMIQKSDGCTPTPVISHAILCHNRSRKDHLSDGIVVTPSHNPPQDGGFKYNPPQGGPADTEITEWIASRANELLAAGVSAIMRIPYEKALESSTTMQYDYIEPYVRDLDAILDMELIRSAGLRIGADALGGSGFAFWPAIAERYGLDIDVIHGFQDATFGFMTVDRDGKIRMDCSSPYAMAGLIALKDRYDIAFGNDPDFDRHGIITPTEGLMNPNHYLSVAIGYLFRSRAGWKSDAGVGKTLVSSSMIDKVAHSLGRKLIEVPVGFKWFVGNLLDGSCGFGGEESAGASFLRKDGTVWTTDKDGIIMSLLAAEITAVTGRNPSEHYQDLENMFGSFVYERLDEPADTSQRMRIKQLTPDQIRDRDLAGDRILTILTQAPWNKEPIGGIKVVTQGGWFAARPSGTEDIYKIYAESFRGRDHLAALQDEAKKLISSVISQEHR
ncbi:MAG: phosphoglucomutase (alpha-D-glucose-1,6-bisphosphate-dependent) [Desulfomonilia bacterium]